NHAFTVTFADGVVQRIVPFAYEPGFYDSLAAMGFAVTTDRFTGVVTLDGGPLSFKPSFYVMPLTAADEDFLNANAHSRGLAYRPGDVNGDGILDYTVLSGEGAQVMYGLRSGLCDLTRQGVMYEPVASGDCIQSDLSVPA